MWVRVVLRGPAQVKCHVERRLAGYLAWRPALTQGIVLQTSRETLAVLAHNYI